MKLEAELEEAQKLAGKVSDLEAKVAMLSSEIKRVSEMNLQKQEKVEKVQTENLVQKEQVEQLRLTEKEFVKLNEAFDQLQQDMQKQVNLSEQKAQELQDALGQKSDLENKVAMLSTEIERFQFKLKSRTDESQQLADKVRELEDRIAQLS